MNPIKGGPSQGIRNSIPELLKLGVHNEVVCLDDSDSPYLFNSNFQIHAIGKAKGPWAYNNKLEEWLNRNISRFDVVIIHGIWLYHSFASIKTLKAHREKSKTKFPKVYVMPHGMLDPWFQNANGRRLKAIRNWLYWKIIESKVVNYADGLLFTSASELVLARQPFQPYHPKKELNVGYGIQAPPPLTSDMLDSYRSKFPELADSRYILFLSRIDIKKGVDILITAYLHLKNNGIQLPKLVIAGPGLDSSYGKQMINLAESDEDIIFPGMLSGEIKWASIYCSEAFILPSHQENFGISVVEALACGKPVLISDQVNIYSEICKGGGGIIGSDDFEGVQQIIKQWIDLSTEQKEEMSKHAKQIYFDNYAIEQAAKRLKETLESN
jgi:glycosyltransferase involved in cell wall biosynthesis